MSTTAQGPRTRAGLVSLVCGTLILVSKFVAWHMTGSSAVLSDALESVVNVVAAGFALWSLAIASRPADHDHPYGHGKVEFMSAAFEGGLIAFAAILIVYHAVGEMVRGPELRSLDVGLAVTVAAGAANLGLGYWVLRQGRRLASPTLVADGQHVLSDVWTTVGVMTGLGLVRLTGVAWIDPLTAILVGLWLLRVGAGLVKEAADALMDREDPEILARVLAAYNQTPAVGLVALHRLRAVRYGASVHVDAHIAAPRHWSVADSHAAVDGLERKLREGGLDGEFAFHVDPCTSAECPGCDLHECPIRGAAFVARPTLSVDQARGRLGR